MFILLFPEPQYSRFAQDRMGRSQSKVDESCLEEDAQLRGNGGGWGCCDVHYSVGSGTGGAVETIAPTP